MSALFTPIKIGNYELKHRVVLAPATRFRATPDNIPTDLQVEYYQQRATEGGLLITEGSFITPSAGGIPRIPGIFSTQQIEAWKRVTEAVHQKKGVIFLQVAHAGRAGLSALNPHGEQIVAPSAIAVTGKTPFGTDYETPRALSTEEIQAILQDFKQAALHALEAGFDGIELHGANGFLIDQFINSNSNQRTDQYGGSIQNRARFALELIDTVASAIGADRLAIRFSPGNHFQDMQDESPVETWRYLIDQIQQNHPDLAYIHLIEARSDIDTEGVNTADSLEPYRSVWKGPLIVAGGFSTNVPHAVSLAEKTGNLIAFGRAFIANPDLPERLRHGWELNPYDRSTFYTYEAAGYTDYPFYNKSDKQ